MFSMPFRKHGVVPLVTYMRIKRKVILGTSRAWAVFIKESPPDVPMAKLEGSTVLPSMLLALVLSAKHVEGKILAERINVYTERIKPSKSLPEACEGK